MMALLFIRSDKASNAAKNNLADVIDFYCYICYYGL